MKLFFAITYALLLVSCSGGPKVEQSKLATSTDLSLYKTFGFFDIDTTGLVNPDFYVQNIEVLKQAVSAEMKARGFEESANPDLKVNMGIVVVEKAETRETDFRTDRPKYMGQRNYSWQSEEIVVGYYREGTLDFHLVEAKENKMVWWGTVSNVVLPDKQKNIPKTIDLSVQKLFEKFPVNPK